MSNGTKVKKRNGSIEPLNLEKMHVMVEEACKGLAGVSLCGFGSPFLSKVLFFSYWQKKTWTIYKSKI